MAACGQIDNDALRKTARRPRNEDGARRLGRFAGHIEAGLDSAPAGPTLGYILLPVVKVHASWMG